MTTPNKLTPAPKPAQAATPPARKPPAPPEGFWTVPGGAAGLQGPPERVCAAVAELPIPEGARDGLLSLIKSELDGRDANFVTVHAHAVRNGDADARKAIFTIQIESRKTL